MGIEPFRIDVPEADLEDLRRRLLRTRWAEDFANDGWQYGMNGAYLRELVGYWRETYDWRVHERAINAHPQFRVVIDEVPIHFLHVRGKGPRCIPLVLNHGWPWTFWDFRKLIGPLTDPAAHGGEAADAFDIVVPSLPGYGFSAPLRRPGVTWVVTAQLWVRLMEKLGYERFASFGADWGAFVTTQLGHQFPDRLIGVHTTLMTPLDLFAGGGGAPEDYGPEGAGRAQKNAEFFQKEAGYFALQTTKPQTPAFALNDSPAGLAAWLIEKRRTWSDCDGEVEHRFSKDDLLTTVMIYWLTQTFGTSARYYYENLQTPWTPAHPRSPVVETPTAITVLAHELIIQPKRWAERYYNLQQWREYPRGGHFGPMEEPEAIIRDLRDFFRERRAPA